MLDIQISTQTAQQKIDALGASIDGLGKKISSAESSTKDILKKMFPADSVRNSLGTLKQVEAVLSSIDSLSSKVNISSKIEKQTTAATSSIKKLSAETVYAARLMNKQFDNINLANKMNKQFDELQIAKKVNAELKKIKQIDLAKHMNNKFDDKARASIMGYISQMEKLASASVREEQQLVQLRKGWNLLTEAQQKAALMTQDTARAMKIVEPLIAKQIDALARYQKQTNALNTARAANIRSGGTQGLSEAQGNTVYRSANAELRRNAVEALKAEQGMRRYAGSAHLGTQATATLRSALHGANINMGYFTASTLAFAAAGYVLSKSVTAAISSGAQFESQFERVAVLLEEFGKIGTDSFGKLSASASVLKDKIFELAESTQFNPTEVAKGAEVLAQAGYETLDVYNALSPVLNLASVGMISVADAADLATGVMSGFKISSSQLSHVVDSLSIATVKSKLSMSDIATTMKYVSGTAGNLGLSLNDTLVALEAMAESNTKASRAGTATRNILPDILGQSEGVTKLLKKLGVDIKSFTHNGILDIKAFFASLKDASVSDIQDAFGKIPANAVLAMRTSALLADEAVGSWANFTKGLRDADGAAKQLTQGMRQNLLAAVETLRGNLETLSSKAFDVFGQGIEDEVRKLTNLLNDNSDTIAATIAKYVQWGVAVANFVVNNAAFIATLLKSLAVYQLLKAGISTFRLAIEGLEVFAKGREISTIIRNQKIMASNKLLEISALSAARAQASIGATGSIIPAVRGTATSGALGVGAGITAARNTAAVETGLVSATRASAGFLGGLTRIATFLPTLLGGLGRVAGFLLGPWGAAISLAATVGFAVYDSMDTGEKQVRRYSNAMEIFALATQNGTRSLQALSQENLKVLSSKLEDDIKTAALELEIANKRKDDAGFDLVNALRTKDVWFIGEDRLTNNLAAFNKAVLGVAEAEAKAALVSDTFKASNDNLQISMGKNFAEAQQLGGALNTNLAPALAELHELTKTPLETFLTFKDPSAQIADAKNFVETLPPLKAKAVIDWANIGALPQETALAAFANITRIKELLIEIQAIDPFSNLLNLDLGKFGGFARNFIKGIDLAKSAAADIGPVVEPKGPSPEALAAESAYKSALQQSMSTMESYIKEFEKRTGSTAELTRQLKELSVVERQIGSGEAAAKLKEMGVSADQAMKALDSGREKNILSFLSQSLAEVDPRFEDLSKALEKTESKAFKLGESLPFVTELLQELVDQGSITPTGMQEYLTRLVPALKDVESGAAQLNKEFDALIEKSKIDWAALNGASTLEDEVRNNAVGKFAGKEDFVRQILAQTKVTALYSEEIKGTLNETEKLAQAELLLTEAYKGQAGAAASVSRIMATLRGNSPTGSLEKENRNLRNQIALVGQGSEALTIYNANWADTNGQLYDLGPAYDSAIKANIRFREELDQMVEVQQTFEKFGEGVAGIFRDTFNGGIKSFGDFASKLKQEFKSLIAELVYMAIKNSIMSSLFGQGSGNSQGFFGAISQGFGQLFGGGGNAQQGSGLGGILSTFLGGGGGGAGGGAGGGLNLGALTSNAVSSYTGATGASGGGLGQFLASLSGGNGLSFGQMASHFSPGFGTAANGSFSTAGKLIKGGQAGKEIIASSQAMPISSLASLINPVTIALAAVTASLSLYKSGWKPQGGSVKYGYNGEYKGGGLPGGWITSTLLGGLLGGGIVTRLFGRKAPEIRSQGYDLNVGPNSASGGMFANIHEQGGLFRRNRDTLGRTGLSPELQRNSDKLSTQIRQLVNSSLRGLTNGVSSAITGSFSQLSDKAGAVIEESVSVLGVKYKGEKIEDLIKRVAAENIFAGLKELTNPQVDSEIETLAASWRGDSSLLLDGAQLLASIQKDIKSANGLFGDAAGSLTLAAASASKYVQENESLVQAYERVKATVTTVEDNFGGFGIALGRTRQEFVDFSMELVNSLGGLDIASDKLRTFAEAYGQIGGGVVSGQAFKRRSTLLEAVGLDANTSGQDFGGAFTRAFPSLSSEDLASWIEAGNSIAVVNNALKEMAASATANAANDLVSQVEAQINAIARLGASEAELAQARAYGNTIIKNALDELMVGIDEGLAGFQGRTNVASLNKIRKEMEANITQARRLGASLSQLARIQQLAAYQIQKVLADLRFSIADLTKQLYDPKNAEEAVNSQLEASNSLYEAEMERYQASQDAIKKIIDFLKELNVSELAPGGTKDRLLEAGKQFREMLAKAQSGDPEALSGITDAAKTYLELAREYFGSTPDYALIFGEVTGALSSLTGMLNQIKPPEGSSSNSSSDSSGTSTQRSIEEIRAERYQLAVQLSQSLGELSIGLKTDVYGLIKEYGIDLVKLAADLGINKGSLDKGSASNIGLMAQALGVPVQGLIDKLGITGRQIADSFGVKFGDYSIKNLTAIKDLGNLLGTSVFDTMKLIGTDIKAVGESLGLTLGNLDEKSAGRLVELATTLGVQSSDLMSALGISVGDLATAYGINIQELNGEMFTKFSEFAVLLGTDILTLGQTLGADFTQISAAIATALTTNLETLPDVPQSIKDELKPFLESIRAADSSEAVRLAVQNLIGFTNLLPEAQRDKLLGLFTSLGLDVSTGSKDIGRILNDYHRLSLPAQTATATATRDTVNAIDETNRFLREEMQPVFHDIRDWITHSSTQEKGFAAPVEEFMGKTKEQQEETSKQMSETNKAQAAQNKEMAEQIKALTEVLYKQSSAAVEQSAESVTELKKINKNTKKAAETPRTKSKKL